MINTIFNQNILLTALAAATIIFGACTDTDKNYQDNSAGSDDNVAAPGNTETEFKDAPDFTLETMEGNTFSLSDQKGKVVVLNFWATWCGPCRKEIPDFMELHEEMEDDGVLFAGISLDEEGWQKVRPYADDMEINYPIMVDNGNISSQYGPIRAIPTTFIINKRGQVEYVAPGMLTKEKLQPILKKLAER